MDRVCSQVDRPARREEVVHADSELRGEVPDAGICCVTVVDLVVRRPSEARILVVRPDHAASALRPRGNSVVPRAGKVPPEQDRGDRDACVGASRFEWSRARTRSGADAALEGGRIGLPEREDLDRVLKVSVQDSRTNVWRQDLACMSPEHEELEVVSVFGDAYASLRQNTQFKRPVSPPKGCLRSGCGLGQQRRG